MDGARTGPSLQNLLPKLAFLASREVSQIDIREENIARRPATAPTCQLLRSTLETQSEVGECLAAPPGENVPLLVLKDVPPWAKQRRGVLTILRKLRLPLGINSIVLRIDALSKGR